MIENFYKGNRESDTQMWDMLFPPGKREWKEMVSGALGLLFFDGNRCEMPVGDRDEGQAGEILSFCGRCNWWR